jgi:aspartyl-tRNA(Asn)/glutamyl-tRNA(Gln) amidotransferase subunit B
VGRAEFGTKTELKNMNSFRFVRQALEYEIRRQRALLAEGREIVQETRLWDTHKGQTFSMRGKEEAHDYRYFPDPDLMPVRIDPEWLTELRASLPELPTARAERFQQELGLPAYDAEVLTSDKALADYFEACLKEFPQPKQVSNWIMVEVMRELKKEEAGIASLKVSPRDLGRLLALVDQGAISGKIAKTVFEEMITSGQEPEAIVREKGLAQISDAGALEDQAREILAAHPKEAADYKAGKTKVMGFFVGQLMKKTKGQANPQLANEIFQKLLS